MSVIFIYFILFYFFCWTVYGDEAPKENITPDDDVFRFLAKQYAKLHPTMHEGQSCENRVQFKEGITNGAAWYETTGWNRFFSLNKYKFIIILKNCFEYIASTFF